MPVWKKRIRTYHFYLTSYQQLITVRKGRISFLQECGPASVDSERSSSMHKQEVLHGLNGWERKVVMEDKTRIGGEGIGVGLAKAYCIHVQYSQ